MNQQLDASMQEFLNSNQHVLVEENQSRVGLSKIFDWYESDFLEYEQAHGNKKGNDQTRLIDFVNRYREADAKIPRDYDVYILEYDKSINSQWVSIKF